MIYVLLGLAVMVIPLAALQLNEWRATREFDDYCDQRASEKGGG